jgi:NAD(P)-dependent dehydrogenase (short-subunit alcohol dehydrogenase family)
MATTAEDLYRSFPAHMGIYFTQTIHTKAEGRTDPLNNKLPSNYVVVVTGAGKGLGYQVAVSYTRAGIAGISISSRTQADLDKLSAELRSINPRLKIHALRCDVTNEDDVKKLAEEVQGTFGRVDAVIANAGVLEGKLRDENGRPTGSPKGITENNDFQRVVGTNIFGTQLTAKNFIPLLIATKDGAKIFVATGSVAGFMEDSQLIPLGYILSKTAINKMIEAIHNDYHEKDGILAYAVHPGASDTPMAAEQHLMDDAALWAQSMADSFADD